MAKITLNEGEQDKLARLHYDHDRWTARMELLQAQHALVQQNIANAETAKQAYLARLGEKYGTLKSVSFESGEVEVEPKPEPVAEAPPAA